MKNDLFPLSVSLISSAGRGKMDADKGKRSLRAKKFASGKQALTYWLFYAGLYCMQSVVRRVGLV
jgi:hypothetical protein